MLFLTAASTTNMSALLSACLLALQGLPLPEAAASSSTHAGTWLAAAALAGTAVASRRTLRRALRRAAWQRLWQGRKKGIESPEFFWAAVMLGAIGLLALVAGMGLLGAIALGCAALCLVRSFL